jgi:hypothetical protein
MYKTVRILIAHAEGVEGGPGNEATINVRVWRSFRNVKACLIGVQWSQCVSSWLSCLNPVSYNSSILVSKGVIRLRVILFVRADSVTVQCCEESCHNQWLVQLIKEHEIQLPLELTSAILGEREQPHWLWLMGHMADQNCNTCHIWRTHCALSQSTTTDSTIAIMYIVSVVLQKYTIIATF